MAVVPPESVLRVPPVAAPRKYIEIERPMVGLSVVLKPDVVTEAYEPTFAPAAFLATTSVPCDVQTDIVPVESAPVNTAPVITAPVVFAPVNVVSVLEPSGPVQVPAVQDAFGLSTYPFQCDSTITSRSFGNN